ncbi:MAG: hypothetical protein HGB11_09460 [Chlorobiales bacterium]|nr:hypothetical protein [Chlorobiales bacterium]
MKKGNIVFGKHWLLVAVLAILGLSGCKEDNSNNATGPRIETTSVFSGTQFLVHSNRLDWSPDGQWITFEGVDNTNPNVYKVTAIANSTPVRVTNYDPVSWDNGGEAVSYLTNGTLAYYVGWFYVADDKNMHVMAAGATQINNAPAPGVLHTFNGSDVGLLANSASSPEAMSLSGDGVKAIVSWGSTAYTLDWSGANVSSALVANASDAAISKDGSKIAYVNSANIVIRAFSGGATTVVGGGSSPSWTQDGRLGYVGNGGYVVYTPGAGTSKTYPSSLYLQNATISWDGTKIAYRTFGGPNTGISVGLLKD